MDERYLVSRIEEQAVELSQVKEELEACQRIIEGIPQRIEEAETNLLQSMARSAWNCGPNCGCSLARSLLQ